MAAPTEGRLRAAALIFASPPMRLTTTAPQLIRITSLNIPLKFHAQLLRRLQIVRIFPRCCGATAPKSKMATVAAGKLDRL